MTAKEQRIAIAEWMFPDFREAIEVDGQLMIHQGEFAGTPIKQQCPDYLNDLNAVHEAEKTLNQEQQFEYHNQLFGFLPCDENHGPAGDGLEDIMTPSGFTMLHATAAQRCEALLRTIGKWKEDK